MNSIPWITKEPVREEVQASKPEKSGVNRKPRRSALW
jgi:hypothetical protein